MLEYQQLQKADMRIIHAQPKQNIRNSWLVESLWERVQSVCAEVGNNKERKEGSGEDILRLGKQSGRWC